MSHAWQLAVVCFMVGAAIRILTLSEKMWVSVLLTVLVCAVIGEFVQGL